MCERLPLNLSLTHFAAIHSGSTYISVSLHFDLLHVVCDRGQSCNMRRQIVILGVSENMVQQSKEGERVNL